MLGNKPKPWYNDYKGDILKIECGQCSECEQKDTILLEETELASKTTSIGLGIVEIKHAKHVRKVYFDIHGVYQMDMIDKPLPK